MNRNEFIQKLNDDLKSLPESEIKDILYDYEEHFEIGLSKGKTEEQISKELGDPRSISKSYRASSMISKAETNPSPKSFFKALLAAMALGFLNLIIVLGPFLLVVGLLIGLYGISIGFIIGGISLLIGSIIAPISSFFININLPILTSVSFGIGLSALGILLLLASFYLSKLLYKATIKYLKWNLDLIKR